MVVRHGPSPRVPGCTHKDMQSKSGICPTCGQLVQKPGVVRRHRVAITVAALALIGACIGVAFAMSGASPQDTTSYKNGYTYGYQNGYTGLAGLGAGGAGALATCLQIGPAMPVGDDPNLWQQGCDAGYDAAVAAQGSGG